MNCTFIVTLVKPNKYIKGQMVFPYYQVPGRDLYSKCSWERHAWPSRKNLSSWFADLVERVGLLRRWTATMSILPNPLWLPGLFNVTAFLTALKQVSSRKLCLPLDNITIETQVTCMETSEEVAAVGSSPPQGALVHGFFIEGARWNCNGQVSVRRCWVVRIGTPYCSISEVRRPVFASYLCYTAR